MSAEVPEPVSFPENVDDIRNESQLDPGIGAEELPDNTATSLINRQVDPDNLGMELENLQSTLSSNEITHRSSYQQNMDGRTPPQKRLD